ncbi:hypothetical protein HZS_6752 [Henneguya salminicola]|nr:hypothetical protein HZS_6752 [Henneguya salminicola]
MWENNDQRYIFKVRIFYEMVKIYLNLKRASKLYLTFYNLCNFILQIVSLLIAIMPQTAISSRKTNNSCIDLTGGSSNYFLCHMNKKVFEVCLSFSSLLYEMRILKHCFLKTIDAYKL